MSHTNLVPSYKSSFRECLLQRDKIEKSNDMFKHIILLQEDRNRLKKSSSKHDDNNIGSDTFKSSQNLQSQFLQVMREKAKMMDQLTELAEKLKAAERKNEELTKEKKELEDKHKQQREQVEIHKREADLFLIEIERRDAEIKTMDNYQKKYLKEVDTIKNKDTIMHDQVKHLQVSLYHMSNYIQKLNIEFKNQITNICKELEQEQQRSYHLEQKLEECQREQQVLDLSQLDAYRFNPHVTVTPQNYISDQSVKAHEGSISTICFNPQCNMFASGSDDNTAILWSYNEEIGLFNPSEIKTATKQISYLSFSEDGSKIVISSKDGIIRVHDAKNSFLYSTLKGHTSFVNCALFLNNGASAISGSHDKTIKLWDVHYQKCVKTMLPGSSCNSIEILSENLVVSGHFDKTLKFHDWRQEQKVLEIETSHSEPITSVDVSFDKNMLVTNSRDNTLQVFDTRSNRVMKILTHPQYCCSTEYLTKAYFKPNTNDVIAVPSCVNSFSENSANGIFIFNTNSNSFELIAHQCRVNDIAFSNNGSLIGATTGKLEIFKQE